MFSTRLIPAILFTACTSVAIAQPVATSSRSHGVDIPAFLQRQREGELRAIVINLAGNPGARIQPELPLATSLAKHGIATFWFNYRGIWRQRKPVRTEGATKADRSSGDA